MAMLVVGVFLRMAAFLEASIEDVVRGESRKISLLAWPAADSMKQLRWEARRVLPVAGYVEKSRSTSMCVRCRDLGPSM